MHSCIGHHLAMDNAGGPHGQPRQRLSGRQWAARLARAGLLVEKFKKEDDSDIALMKKQRHLKNRPYFSKISLIF